MAVERLLRAIGTLHCPSCQMPLFANLLDDQDEAGEVDASSCRFVAPFIMMVDNTFAEAARLIDAVERLDLWCPSAVVGNEEAGYGRNRTNDFVLLSGQLDDTLGEFEAGLRRIFHGAAKAYARTVGHLQLRGDLGYQLLRYGPGQHFTEHVDEMPGANVYGQRQVTAILYLNDDFEGGELELPRQNLVYKPKAGTLVLFPSGFCFPHASSDVARGTKYSVVTWFI